MPSTDPSAHDEWGTTIAAEVRTLYDEFGQRKPMGVSAPNSKLPHFFLLRTFEGENDLLIILNTKRCRYQCDFCTLPVKSSRKFIPGQDILDQYRYVVHELKHGLSILDRVTLSNEGSVLDAATLPTDALLTIAAGVNELRRVRTFVLETRLEYVDPSVLQQIQRIAPRAETNILTGFETHDPYIRDEVLYKREPLARFESGLDRVAETKSSLTAYVLFKPSPTMTDDDALVEAETTVDYLVEQCKTRGIRLTIRLNPMYLARGSKWARLARATPLYSPPRLTDVMRLAEKKVSADLPIYIGLSTEGLDESGGTYMSREDYSPSLIRQVKQFNDRKTLTFELRSSRVDAEVRSGHHVS